MRIHTERASRLLLVRHGETIWNREQRWQGHADVPLSDLGHEQASAVGERLRRMVAEPAAIDSSDLVRARDTAAAAAALLGLSAAEDAGLREMDVGSWSGLSRDEIRDRFAEPWARIAVGEDLPRGGGERRGGRDRHGERAVENDRRAPARTRSSAMIDFELSAARRVLDYGSGDLD